MVKEMEKLRKLLDAKGVKWEDASDNFLTKKYDWKIDRTHFEYKGRKYSAINGFGTYGGYYRGENNMGLIELMIGNNEPIGYLTAQDVIDYMDGVKQ